MRGGIVAVTAAVAAVTCGCGGPSEPTPPVSSKHAESTDFAQIPGQFPTPAALTTNGQEQAPVGGCANLSGPGVNAVFKIVDCGSPENTYRIIQRVNVPTECADADRSFYHNSKDTGQYTVCLDLAWDKTSCIRLGQPVSKIACTDTTTPGDRIKPIKIVLDTTTLDGCSDGGYKHPQRRFTVCTETQR